MKRRTKIRGTRGKPGVTSLKCHPSPRPIPPRGPRRGDGWHFRLGWLSVWNLSLRRIVGHGPSVRRLQFVSNSNWAVALSNVCVVLERFNNITITSWISQRFYWVLYLPDFQVSISRSGYSAEFQNKSCSRAPGIESLPENPLLRRMGNILTVRHAVREARFSPLAIARSPGGRILHVSYSTAGFLHFGQSGPIQDSGAG